MKILFSRYNFLVNELSEIAYHLGFRGNLSLHFCKHLGLKGRPIHPARKLITTPEMKKLVDLAERCYSDLFLFLQILP